MAAATERCSECRGTNRPGACFCRHCGHELAAASLARATPRTPVRVPAFPTDEVVSKVRSLVDQAATWRGRAGTSTRGLNAWYAGGLLVLLGSFLPLASAGAVGRSLALVPDIANQVDSVYLVPLAALAFIAMAALFPRLIAPLRSTCAGLCIALASPGVLLVWTMVRVGNSLAGTFLGKMAQGSVGIGAVALLGGFLSALIGSFVVLWHLHSEASEGEQPI